MCGHPPCLTLTTLPGDHPAVVTLRGSSGVDVARSPISIRELCAGLPPLVCVGALGRGATTQSVVRSRGSEVVGIAGKVEPCDRMNASHGIASPLLAVSETPVLIGLASLFFSGAYSSTVYRRQRLGRRFPSSCQSSDRVRQASRTTSRTGSANMHNPAITPGANQSLIRYPPEPAAARSGGHRGYPAAVCA